MGEKEVSVAKVGDLKDGEMKQVSVDGTDILLANVAGRHHAVAAHCTHYGAPLVNGVLNGERIVCPWHHACFNITTGDLEEPPALDALVSYEVKIEGDQVNIHIPDDGSDRRTPAMTKRAAGDERLFAIVGGGAAGYVAAQTLREDGFMGRVVLITRERNLPYDRPNLSKEYLQGRAEPEWLPLRPDEFFTEHDIEIFSSRAVERVDASQKTVQFADGEILECDAILIATGGEPRKLPFQSDDQENVFLLRSHADSDAIIAVAEKGKRAVLIGGSFIGMEVTASLVARGCDVTVVTPDSVPFQKTLGKEIGNLLQSVHEQNGVNFKLGAHVTGFDGTRKIEAVILENGERLNADLVVVGIGVKPATQFLVGVDLHLDGGVIVDEYMCVADGIYAAGDIAWFPSALTGERQRIEHWRTAQQQGRIAAHNMAGKKTAYDGVPFFWTRQFDVGLLYVGHATSWDEIIFQGGVSAQNFLAFYVKEDSVLAVAGMSRDRDMAAIEELMRLHKMPSATQLKKAGVNFAELLEPTSSRERRRSLVRSGGGGN